MTTHPDHSSAIAQVGEETTSATQAFLIRHALHLHATDRGPYALGAALVAAQTCLNIAAHAEPEQTAGMLSAILSAHVKRFGPIPGWTQVKGTLQ